MCTEGSTKTPRQQLLLNYQNKSTPATGGVIKGKWKYLLMEVRPQIHIQATQRR